MRQIIPYVITGVALAMLVGGVILIGNAIKTWMHERNPK
jgi:cell division protein FtsX